MQLFRTEPGIRRYLCTAVIHGLTGIAIISCGSAELSNGVDFAALMTAYRSPIEPGRALLPAGLPERRFRVEELQHGDSQVAEVTSIAWRTAPAACHLDMVSADGLTLLSYTVANAGRDAAIQHEAIPLVEGERALALGVGTGLTEVIDLFPGPAFQLRANGGPWRRVEGMARPMWSGTSAFLQTPDGGIVEAWLAAARFATFLDSAGTPPLMYRLSALGELISTVGAIEPAPTPELTGRWNRGFPLIRVDTIAYVRPAHGDILIFGPGSANPDRKLVLPVPVIPDSAVVFRPPSGGAELLLPDLIATATTEGDSILVVVLNTLEGRGSKQRVGRQIVVRTTWDGEPRELLRLPKAIQVQSLRAGCGGLAAIVSGEGPALRPVLLVPTP
jgi:hypothetical protein